MLFYLIKKNLKSATLTQGNLFYLALSLSIHTLKTLFLPKKYKEK